MKIDNFLSPEIFSMFVAECEQLSQGITSGGRSKPVKVTGSAEIRAKLGIKWYVYFQRVQALFPSKIEPESCRLQVTKDEPVDWHWDGALPLGSLTANLAKSYTSILYTSPTWAEQPDEAGAWQSRDGTIIQPTPNRLIIYSRDIEHRVIPGVWPGIRSLALLSFYEL